MFEVTAAIDSSFEFEENLHSDWVLFNAVRKLMPSLYRLHIINVDGKDIGETELDILNGYTRVDSRDGALVYAPGNIP